MTTRRGFLQGALATSGLALAGTSLQSSASSLADIAGNGAQRLHAVVYEPADLASAEFGALSKQLGHATHAIDGDVTTLWTQCLAEQWRKKPIAIAGMTHAGALFVLERFGWDHGLRVLFRAEHKPQGDGSVAHVLAGPASMLHTYEALAAEKYDYAQCMAGVIGQCPEHAASPATKSLLTPRAVGTHATRPMYTWVIGPRQSAALARTGENVINGITL
ncbi:twin-arginine translocation signal domain-containing protein [Candidimonas sp. SYP-B2681]|uniref:twin-arginine translocation signal domain-containing protein n=1 Tax=Candidimonas sp. SYP-B2681 TaxID=2497686 RepID=UPI000F87C75B|nr:twin-arginine translocation signal domain-containing protein [Candidimonas sp. SYP-B2681]RTZ45456.1 twin-arginine translocation signal domain-containing protein [Candidimonas sp. SYP-B2681]